VWAAVPAVVVGPTVLIALNAPVVPGTRVSLAVTDAMQTSVSAVPQLIAATVAAGLTLLVGPTVATVAAAVAFVTMDGPEVTVDTVVGPVVVVRVVSLVTTPLVVTTDRVLVVVVVAASENTVVVSTS
jgi:hypothetical protein